MPVSENKVLAEPKKDQLKCEKCDYKCKKEGPLFKHMNSKKEPQECKVCFKSFLLTVELLQHIAKEHNSNEEENEKNY